MLVSKNNEFAGRMCYTKKGDSVFVQSMGWNQINKDTVKISGTNFYYNPKDVNSRNKINSILKHSNLYIDSLGRTNEIQKLYLWREEALLPDSAVYHFLVNLLKTTEEQLTLANSSLEKQLLIRKKYEIIDHLREIDKPINKIKNDLTVLNLKGKVKTLYESTFNVEDKFGKIQKGDLQNKIVTSFNESGNESEKTYYKSDGSLSAKYTHKYNNDGSEIERNYYSLINNNLSWKIIYKYDSNGNKIKENWYDLNGNLTQMNIYKYDDKGNMIEYDNYKTDGSLFYKESYKYNDKGYKIETNSFDPNARLISKDTYKYNDNGNMIVDDIFYPNYSSNQYTKNGDKIEGGSDKYTYKYDNNGNTIEQVSYNDDGINTYNDKYDFDKTGNWIKEILLKNSTVQNIIERVIVYY
jgi:hypothetical protein